MAKPDALLFDFGGTLDCPSHWLDRFLAHYKAGGIEIARDELDGAFDFATKTGYAAGKSIERFKLGDLVRFLVGNQFEFLRASGSERFKEWLGRMDSRERFRLVERIRDSFLVETAAGLAKSRHLLNALHKTYRIGVISNWYGNLEAIIAEAGMKSLIDAVTDSGRIGIFKPDPGIYKEALKLLRSEPSATAMIGDSMRKDIAPAHEIGMRTVWLRHANAAVAAAQESDGIGADYTIDSLQELADLRW
jgi:HAD superfamily hydrolase (TIGR01509 family)